MPISRQLVEAHLEKILNQYKGWKPSFERWFNDKGINPNQSIDRYNLITILTTKLNNLATTEATLATNFQTHFLDPILAAPNKDAAVTALLENFSTADNENKNENKESKGTESNENKKNKKKKPTKNVSITEKISTLIGVGGPKEFIDEINGPDIFSEAQYQRLWRDYPALQKVLTTQFLTGSSIVKTFAENIREFFKEKNNAADIDGILINIAVAAKDKDTLSLQKAFTDNFKLPPQTNPLQNYTPEEIDQLYAELQFARLLNDLKNKQNTNTIPQAGIVRAEMEANKAVFIKKLQACNTANACDQIIIGLLDPNKTPDEINDSIFGANANAGVDGIANANQDIGINIHFQLKIITAISNLDYFKNNRGAIPVLAALSKPLSTEQDKKALVKQLQENKTVFQLDDAFINFITINDNKLNTNKEIQKIASSILLQANLVDNIIGYTQNLIASIKQLPKQQAIFAPSNPQTKLLALIISIANNANNADAIKQVLKQAINDGLIDAVSLEQVDKNFNNPIYIRTAALVGLGEFKKEEWVRVIKRDDSVFTIEQMENFLKSASNNIKTAWKDIIGEMIANGKHAFLGYDIPVETIKNAIDVMSADSLNEIRSAVIGRLAKKKYSLLITRIGGINIKFDDPEYHALKRVALTPDATTEADTLNNIRLSLRDSKLFSEEEALSLEDTPVKEIRPIALDKIASLSIINAILNLNLLDPTEINTLDGLKKAIPTKTGEDWGKFKNILKQNKKTFGLLDLNDVQIDKIENQIFNRRDFKEACDLLLTEKFLIEKINTEQDQAFLQQLTNSNNNEKTIQELLKNRFANFDNIPKAGTVVNGVQLSGPDLDRMKASFKNLQATIDKIPPPHLLNMQLAARQIVYSSQAQLVTKRFIQKILAITSADVDSKNKNRGFYSWLLTGLASAITPIDVIKVLKTIPQNTRTTFDLPIDDDVIDYIPDAFTIAENARTHLTKLNAELNFLATENHIKNIQQPTKELQAFANANNEGELRQTLKNLGVPDDVNQQLTLQELTSLQITARQHLMPMMIMDGIQKISSLEPGKFNIALGLKDPDTFTATLQGNKNLFNLEKFSEQEINQLTSANFDLTKYYQIVTPLLLEISYIQNLQSDGHNLPQEVLEAFANASANDKEAARQVATRYTNIVITNAQGTEPLTAPQHLARLKKLRQNIAANIHNFPNPLNIRTAAIALLALRKSAELNAAHIENQLKQLDPINNPADRDFLKALVKSNTAVEFNDHLANHGTLQLSKQEIDQLNDSHLEKIKATAAIVLIPFNTQQLIGGITAKTETDTCLQAFGQLPNEHTAAVAPQIIAILKNPDTQLVNDMTEIEYAALAKNDAIFTVSDAAKFKQSEFNYKRLQVFVRDIPALTPELLELARIQNNNDPKVTAAEILTTLQNNHNYFDQISIEEVAQLKHDIQSLFAILNEARTKAAAFYFQNLKKLIENKNLDASAVLQALATIPNGADKDATALAIKQTLIAGKSVLGNYENDDYHLLTSDQAIELRTTAFNKFVALTIINAISKLDPSDESQKNIATLLKNNFDAKNWVGFKNTLIQNEHKPLLGLVNVSDDQIKKADDSIFTRHDFEIKFKAALNILSLEQELIAAIRAEQTSTAFLEKLANNNSEENIQTVLREQFTTLPSREKQAQMDPVALKQLKEKIAGYLTVIEFSSHLFNIRDAAIQELKSRQAKLAIQAAIEIKIKEISPISNLLTTLALSADITDHNPLNAFQAILVTNQPIFGFTAQEIMTLSRNQLRTIQTTARVTLAKLNTVALQATIGDKVDHDDAGLKALALLEFGDEIAEEIITPDIANAIQNTLSANKPSFNNLDDKEYRQLNSKQLYDTYTQTKTKLIELNTAFVQGQLEQLNPDNEADRVILKAFVKYQDEAAFKNVLKTSGKFNLTDKEINQVIKEPLITTLKANAAKKLVSVNTQYLINAIDNKRETDASLQAFGKLPNEHIAAVAPQIIAILKNPDTQLVNDMTEIEYAALAKNDVIFTVSDAAKFKQSEFNYQRLQDFVHGITALSSPLQALARIKHNTDQNIMAAEIVNILTTHHDYFDRISLEEVAKLNLVASLIEILEEARTTVAALYTQHLNDLIEIKDIDDATLGALALLPNAANNDNDATAAAIKQLLSANNSAFGNFASDDYNLLTNIQAFTLRATALNRFAALTITRAISQFNSLDEIQTEKAKNLQRAIATNHWENVTKILKKDKPLFGLGAFNDDQIENLDQRTFTENLSTVLTLLSFEKQFLDRIKGKEIADMVLEDFASSTEDNIRSTLKRHFVEALPSKEQQARMEANKLRQLKTTIEATEKAIDHIPHPLNISTVASELLKLRQAVRAQEAFINKILAIDINDVNNPLLNQLADAENTPEAVIAILKAIPNEERTAWGLPANDIIIEKMPDPVTIAHIAAEHLTNLRLLEIETRIKNINAPTQELQALAFAQTEPGLLQALKKLGVPDDVIKQLTQLHLTSLQATARQHLMPLMIIEAVKNISSLEQEKVGTVFSLTHDDKSQFNVDNFNKVLLENQPLFNLEKFTEVEIEALDPLTFDVEKFDAVAVPLMYEEIYLFNLRNENFPQEVLQAFANVGAEDKEAARQVAKEKIPLVVTSIAEDADKLDETERNRRLIELQSKTENNIGHFPNPLNIRTTAIELLALHKQDKLLEDIASKKEISNTLRKLATAGSNNNINNIIDGLKIINALKEIPADKRSVWGGLSDEEIDQMIYIQDALTKVYITGSIQFSDLIKTTIQEKIKTIKLISNFLKDLALSDNIESKEAFDSFLNILIRESEYFGVTKEDILRLDPHQVTAIQTTTREILATLNTLALEVTINEKRDREDVGLRAVALLDLDKVVQNNEENSEESDEDEEITAEARAKAIQEKIDQAKAEAILDQLIDSKADFKNLDVREYQQLNSTQSINIYTLTKTKLAELNFTFIQDKLNQLNPDNTDARNFLIMLVQSANENEFKNHFRNYFTTHFKFHRKEIDLIKEPLLTQIKFTAAKKLAPFNEKLLINVIKAKTGTDPRLQVFARLPNTKTEADAKNIRDLLKHTDTRIINLTDIEYDALENDQLFNVCETAKAKQSEFNYVSLQQFIQGILALTPELQALARIKNNADQNVLIQHIKNILSTNHVYFGITPTEVENLNNANLLQLLQAARTRNKALIPAYLIHIVQHATDMPALRVLAAVANGANDGAAAMAIKQALFDAKVFGNLEVEEYALLTNAQALHLRTLAIAAVTALNKNKLVTLVVTTTPPSAAVVALLRAFANSNGTPEEIKIALKELLTGPHAAVLDGMTDQEIAQLPPVELAALCAPAGQRLTAYNQQQLAALIKSVTLAPADKDLFSTILKLIDVLDDNAIKNQLQIPTEPFRVTLKIVGLSKKEIEALDITALRNIAAIHVAALNKAKIAAILAAPHANANVFNAKLAVATATTLAELQALLRNPAYKETLGNLSEIEIQTLGRATGDVFTELKTAANTAINEAARVNKDNIKNILRTPSTDPVIHAAKLAIANNTDAARLKDTVHMHPGALGNLSPNEIDTLDKGIGLSALYDELHEAANYGLPNLNRARILDNIIAQVAITPTLIAFAEAKYAANPDHPTEAEIKTFFISLTTEQKKELFGFDLTEAQINALSNVEALHAAALTRYKTLLYQDIVKLVPAATHPGLLALLNNATYKPSLKTYFAKQGSAEATKFIQTVIHPATAYKEIKNLLTVPPKNGGPGFNDTQAKEFAHAAFADTQFEVSIVAMPASRIKEIIVANKVFIKTVSQTNLGLTAPNNYQLFLESLINPVTSNRLMHKAALSAALKYKKADGTYEVVPANVATELSNAVFAHQQYERLKGDYFQFSFNSIWRGFMEDETTAIKNALENWNVNHPTAPPLNTTADVNALFAKIKACETVPTLDIELAKIGLAGLSEDQKNLIIADNLRAKKDNYAFMVNAFDRNFASVMRAFFTLSQIFMDKAAKIAYSEFGRTPEGQKQLTAIIAECNEMQQKLLAYKTHLETSAPKEDNDRLNKFLKAHFHTPDKARDTRKRIADIDECLEVLKDTIKGKSIESDLHTYESLKTGSAEITRILFAGSASAETFTFAEDELFPTINDLFKDTMKKAGGGTAALDPNNHARIEEGEVNLAKDKTVPRLQANTADRIQIVVPGPKPLFSRTLEKISFYAIQKPADTKPVSYLCYTPAQLDKIAKDPVKLLKVAIGYIESFRAKMSDRNKPIILAGNIDERLLKTMVAYCILKDIKFINKVDLTLKISAKEQQRMAAYMAKNPDITETSITEEHHKAGDEANAQKMLQHHKAGATKTKRDEEKAQTTLDTIKADSPSSHHNNGRRR